MKNLALNSSPEHYHQYINLVEDTDIKSLLENGGIEPYLETIDILDNLGDKVYQVGKWTVKEMLQHLIDVERLFMNRALRFLRTDPTPVPGFDHDKYVMVSRVDHLTVEELLEEYQILRLSTVLFFKHLSDEELSRSGTANGVSISLIAIAFILVGHPLHHFKVLEEKYFAL